MKGGRPKGSTKLTSDIIESLRHHLVAGMTIKEACRLSGVSYPSFYRWRLKGNRIQRGIFREFHRVIEPIFQEKEAVIEAKRQEYLAGVYERFARRKARDEKRFKRSSKQRFLIFQHFSDAETKDSSLAMPEINQSVD